MTRSVVAEAVAGWERIPLADVEARAPLLDRQETKYLVDAPTLARALADAEGAFDVLAIDGLTEFAYDTVYFDTADLSAYRSHAAGRRRKVKVRSRQYVDSGLTFVEVKLKGRRDRTVKERLRVAPDDHGRLDHVAAWFVDRCLRTTYGTPLAEPLGPSLAMDFHRTTLVGRGAPERVTIDRALVFRSPTGPAVAAPGSAFVVEVKSETGRGVADRHLRAAGGRAGPCSKYCVGLNLVRRDLRYNAFKPVLTRGFRWSPPV